MERRAKVAELTMERSQTLTVDEMAENIAKILTGYDRIPLTDKQTLELRKEGKDWPEDAVSMIGLKRMRNIHDLYKMVRAKGIDGDLMECGVWRGGASIFMRELLDLYHDDKRRVILADSFQGMPPTDDRKDDRDRGTVFGPDAYLAVSLEEVMENFGRYTKPTQLQFIPGWFKDTLYTADIGTLAILRLDGDLYESTMTCLSALYGHVSSGGFVIIDDYALPTCRRAVDEFRERWAINEPMTAVDYSGVWWRKQ